MEASFVSPLPEKDASASNPYEVFFSLVYPARIKEYERHWRDRYNFLLTHGYKLRSRYHPDWTPSWKTPGTKQKNPVYCEDAHEHVIYMVMDALRTADNSKVCIKRITKASDEIAIGKYLTSEELLSDSKNHCLPVLDDFVDPEDPTISYMIMPLLRDFNDPEFGAHGEVIDCVTQLLEGLVFMHDHLVAHTDLTTVNIMMDAQPILPQGWHFASPSVAPNGYENIKPLPRIDYPVRYYLIDFDGSIRFSPGESPVIKGVGGRDNDPPELITPHIPFDQYKLDVFTLGNVFRKEFQQKYLNLDFLDGLIPMMMTHDFRQRPTSQAVLDYWYKTRERIPIASARWPLRKPTETIVETVINTVAAARSGVNNLRYLFEEDKRTWANP
ncbi:hypothetical protein E4T56_gene19317 [Termitomyces sp. T112]|nr:hypothetical protein E4T56_gene19317 [Termitomyces sp. T112]